MKNESLINDYKSFLDSGKTERECVDALISLAEQAGFRDVFKTEFLKAGDKVYVQKMNKAIALFVVGSSPIEEGMNILGAHIDSPRLDVKQNPLYENNFLVYLNTHYYGGVKKYQWVTIPLAMHGLVVKKDGTVIEITIGENETDPVVWRGSLIAGTVKQFWTDVHWGELDVMFVDMPPGTGDVPLTVFQSLPIDGIVIVTSPQELVQMIVKKAYNMAGMMNIPVLGVVENYSYLSCPDCGKKHSIFGSSHIDAIAAENGIDTIARIPIRPEFAGLCITVENISSFSKKAKEKAGRNRDRSLLAFLHVI